MLQEMADGDIQKEEIENGEPMSEYMQNQKLIKDENDKSEINKVTSNLLRWEKNGKAHR